MGFLLFVLILGGCGPDTPKKTAEQAQIQQHPSAKPETQQSTPDPEVTEKIRDTYQWYCAQCHGEKGEGDGINARYLTVPPRNHTKADYLETRTDQQLIDTIKLGGLAMGRAPCMPAWGNTLDDDTIHGLMRYIRELCRCEAT